ncbi:MAG: flagellar basal-body rod protein FlgF [Nitrosospira sp.]
MDRMIYTAMSGAKHTMGQQASVSNNLANANTTGYRSETSALRAVPVFSEALATRAFVVDSTAGADFRPGTLQQTGRDLDVAVQGAGWIAVQMEDGTEAYTRNGDLHVSVNGVLQTRDGVNVQGEAGPISVSPNSTITVAKDGTVSTVPFRPGSNESNVVLTAGRIKLVNPPESQLTRGADGLFRLTGGGRADEDTNVSLVGGTLEGSNVNVVEALVDMISLARQFETHMKLLQNAQGNAQKAGSLLSMSG